MSGQFQEQLNKWAEKNKVKVKKTRIKRKEWQKANRGFSERELKELMGIHRPIYTRKKGGAFRQKG
ncbi:hypothetical protein [Gracilibacillus xinjiangensis]|uniref:Phage protein n=1 Tax=Gracilibacillus xinjiangensis TaxID=1193282 RepID=A0ABV8WTV4_9BACI